MLSIAIVEDDPQESSSLKQKLDVFFASRQAQAKIEIYDNPLAFLSRYSAQYDILFFDIEMPGLDGVSATKKIREIDDKVMIIFVTAMGQLAVEGYRVEAFDFLVKPVPFSLLESTLDRAIKRLSYKARATIKISFKGGVRVVEDDDLTYVEVLHHRLLYHLKSGECVEAWGSLKDLEKDLPVERFGRCNSCYIVNYAEVIRIDGDSVVLKETELKISRAKKAEFLQGLISFVGA